MAHSKIETMLREWKYLLGQALRPKTRQLYFVTGIARSGTTAITAWIGQQPKVKSFNESRILLALHAFHRTGDRFENLKREKAFLSSSLLELAVGHYSKQASLLGKHIIVDKEPYFPLTFHDAQQYGDFLRFLLRMFPDMKILSMLREPVATIWSMTQRRWGYSIATIEEPISFELPYYIETWNNGMMELFQLQDHERVLFCKYEELEHQSIELSSAICDFFDIAISRPFNFVSKTGVGFTEEDQIKILEECGSTLKKFYREDELEKMYSSSMLTKSGLV